MCFCLSTGNITRQKTYERNCQIQNMPSPNVFEKFKVTYFERNFLQSENIIHAITDKLEKLIIDLDIEMVPQ